ncbi:MAG: Co2+/Mg2+ efflux protein ApaG [Flavobacteriales bacterium]|nr:Co2+/Mg2+ efflux protein ApaG [Flavobacteriales bacterium]
MTSYTAITSNVEISVSSRYYPPMSDSENKTFVFVYHICIQNRGKQPVHILRRYWKIKDSAGFSHEVNGEGVVGEKPIILPNESYEYESWCHLQTDMGSMKGHYEALLLDTQEEVKIEIPEFLLIPEYKLN